LAFGTGVYIILWSGVDIVTRRSEYLKSFNLKLQSHQFALKLNMSLIVSITITLIASVGTKEYVVFGTIVGFSVGWFSTQMYLAKEARNQTLQLTLATATLAEDCAILCTTHLGVRQSLALALSTNNDDLKKRVSSIMDLESSQQLLVNQLKELSHLERDTALGRFGRTLAIALERGNSPEASLVQLAGEIRNNARRALLQLAAKKEIAMMVPVVFAVLPSVTAIALFPAMKSLQHL
jgi:tight adherence protein C